MNKIKILLSGLFLVSASAVMAQGAKNIRITIPPAFRTSTDSVKRG